MQETEVPSNFPLNVLNSNGYCLELEKSSDKMRVGVYLHNDIIYKRRFDLEEIDTHVVIIDVVSTINKRIINIYRSFCPPDGSSATNFFAKQLNIIKSTLCNNCYIMGDFNLECGKDLCPDYKNKLLLETLNNFATENKLLQRVNFKTWSRTINGVKKSHC